MLHLQKAIDTVRALGVPVRLADRGQAGTFLDGAWVDGEGVVVWPDRVLLGDVFHEAGHWAVTPSSVRGLWRPGTNLEDPDSPLLRRTGEILDHAHDPDELGVRALLQMGECEAIAWEYAALVEAGIPPEEAFGHPERFSGEGLELVSMLRFGAHFGVHGLAHAEMTTRALYPRMLRWVQV